MRFWMRLSLGGSSPHARGALQELVVVVTHAGIIPACAGSTLSDVQRSREGRDHPRMRGEHHFTPSPRDFTWGSSPHARGARACLGQTLVKSGIILACAGSTGRSGAVPSGCRDHPRMRGEHSVALFLTLSFRGSSPHSRGARRCSGRPGRRPRIIPACAGSTPSSRRGRRDHPRMRGEHVATAPLPNANAGSSPHARGAPCPSAHPTKAQRIIPACAGSTMCGCTGVQCIRDHPRMRGEHIALEIGISLAQGSSPHARGAHEVPEGVHPMVGIIPACAGSTCSYCSIAATIWNHPRMRGEHTAPPIPPSIHMGSSPHARGAHTHAFR